MDAGILNIEQAMDFLGVSEKTLIKLLREEHLPARKIGREWRFSRAALADWLSKGDSWDYVNRNEGYQLSQDTSGQTGDLMDAICAAIANLRLGGNNLQSLLGALEQPVFLPEEAKLRVSYKQKRDVEKLEFKIFWDLRDQIKPESERQDSSEV